MTMPAANRTAYINARLLDPATGLDCSGALLVEDGIIVDLGPGLFADGVPDGIATVDCQGHCLAPGLVDMHACLREPGAEHQETFASAGQTAAAGGIATIVARPDTSPPIDEVALLEFVERRGRSASCVNIYSMAALTRGLAGGEVTEIGLLSEAGAVAFTDGDRAVADATVMRRALSYATAFDALIVQPAEEPSLAANGAMNEGEIATRLGLAGIPACAETILLERDIRLVELTGARYHAAHLSTAQAIDSLRHAKARRLRISAGAAPFSFALNETAVEEYRTFTKVKPPLRTEDDRAAVVKGLADGTIDVISSGHAPWDQDSKRLPFAQAEFGVVGLETMLPVALELHHNGSLPLLGLLAKMTCNPARLLRLDGGRLAKGAPADLVIFDLDTPWRIDEAKLRSKCKNTPFDGRPVQGRALRTVVGGRTVFEYGREG